MSGARPGPPNAWSSSIVVAADRDAPANVSEWIRAQCTVCALAPPLADRIDVCAAELVANVVEHGACGAPETTIRVELLVDASKVRLVIDDDAAPFDPIVRASPAPVRMNDDRVGGWGLAIVRRFTHHLDYARTSTGNQLTATFVRAAGAPQDA